MSNIPMNLSEYIQLHIDIPFEWGKNDCVIFTIGWLEHRTKNDYLSRYKPWKSGRQAKKKLRGLKGLFFLFEQNLKQINPNMARDGDLTIFQGAAHLFSGRHIVSVGETGLVFTDRCIVKKAWTYKCQR